MSAPQPIIHVLGSLNVDEVSYVSHHPRPGETLIANGFESGCGGKGANQAIACAKLSRTSTLDDATVNVAMIGAVGADASGVELVQSLASCGVDTSMITVNKSGGEEAKTGRATIIIDESDGQNRIILSPGANGSVLPTRFEQATVPKPNLVVLQMEVPPATVAETIQAAKAANIPVLLNQAPALPLPAEVYQGMDHLILNETEAAVLSNVSESELENSLVLTRIAGQFLDKGIGNIVITLGARGVFYACRSGKTALLPALKVKAIDTTAAGDTFIGAYAVAFVEAIFRGEVFKIEDAVAYAIKASSITVSRQGAQGSIPWRNELDVPTSL